VRNSLRALEGIRQVEVDLDEKQAAVIYETAKVKTSSMIEATTNIGFPSSINSPDQ
jgi:mercuric ion binding protein